MTYPKVGKRLLDILFAFPLFLAMGVVCIVLVPAIRLVDGGPAFYVAERLGRHRKVFRMVKFRSMRMNAPDLRLPDGSTYNSDDDPRLTKIGRFLRSTSLDELPQVINVLRGDMSIVGPRPDLPSQLSLYAGDDFEKLIVRPGITGYSQAYFRNSIAWKVRLRHDVHYARNVSLRMDLRIILKTVQTVFLRKNVYAKTADEENASVPPSNEAEGQRR